jgi:pheromone shutdown protein TraB
MHFKHQNVTIVGTSHVAEESMKEIEELFQKETFAVVGIELDPNRVQSLMSNEKRKPGFGVMTRNFGMRAALFAMFASWAQKKIGKLVGLDPGSDMKQAIILAAKHKIPLACIDQDIRVTLKRLNRQLNFGFVWNIIKDIVGGLLFPKKMKKKLGIDKLDLSRLPSEEVIAKVLDAMRLQYPGLFNVLVDERNIVMTKNIIMMQNQFNQQQILAVVGAGHIAGIKKLLQDHVYEAPVYTPRIDDIYHNNVDIEYNKMTTSTNTSKRNRRAVRHD